MRTKQGLHLRRIGDEHLMITESDSHVDLSHIISLNPTAARLWQEVEGTAFTATDLAGRLTMWYEIDPETALSDAHKLIEQWTAAGLTE